MVQHQRASVKWAIVQTVAVRPLGLGRRLPLSMIKQPSRNSQRRARAVSDSIERPLAISKSVAPSAPYAAMN
jgi:hypothetical protein